MRIDWDEYFMRGAEWASQRADCRRAKHGAMIVKDNRVVAVGYNGTPSGSPLSCLAGDCPRGLLSEKDQPHNAGGYESCINLHAEQNAIAHANREDCIGATIFVTGTPCPMCDKLIQAAGITRVVVRK